MAAPKLLDQVRTVARLRHLSLKTEQAYVQQIKRFIFFHNKRHPQEMREDEIRAYLSHLAVDCHVAASTQNVALAALLFLYRDVLNQAGENRKYRASAAANPHAVVFTKEEVARVLSNLSRAGCARPAGRMPALPAK